MGFEAEVGVETRKCEKPDMRIYWNEDGNNAG